MFWPIAWILVGLLGCIPNFESIDEACTDNFKGSKVLSSGALDIVTRLNCYRRYEALHQGPVHPAAQDAALGHMTYLIREDILGQGLDPFNQDPNSSFFTGETVEQRLDNAEAIAPEYEDFQIWSVLWSDASAEGVDDLMHSPYARDIFFQPFWITAGAAEGVTSEDLPILYMNLVYAFPPARRMFKPIVYPKDGQTGVPVSYASPYGAEDPLGGGELIGYPISITVGAEVLGESAENPYDLFVMSATLTGPEGIVDTYTVGPQVFSWGAFQSTIAIASRQPLLANATYELEARLLWTFGSRTVNTTFTTGTNVPDDTAAARSLPMDWSDAPRIANTRPVSAGR